MFGKSTRMGPKPPQNQFCAPRGHNKATINLTNFVVVQIRQCPLKPLVRDGIETLTLYLVTGAVLQTTREIYTVLINIHIFDLLKKKKAPRPCEHCEH